MRESGNLCFLCFSAGLDPAAGVNPPQVQVVDGKIVITHVRGF